jgi:MFS transporter, ACS family, tartrate transporter
LAGTLHTPDVKPFLSTAFELHTRRHIAWRLLPFLFALYITSYLDRANVAYAALDMNRNLGFSDRVFGLGTGVFFITYLALQIPGALLVERWSARRMISATLIAWGSLTSLTGLIHSPGQFYFARFALGAAEAGFFPGVIVYLSHWFIQEDRAKATGNFMGAIPLSFVLGSPIAGWILGHSWLGVQGWRWLFVLEGIPAIVLGVVAFFFLTDLPAQAAWLRPEQGRWIDDKLRDERSVSTETTTVWQALRSPAILMLAAVAFLNYFSGYILTFWLPTLLKRQSGLSDFRVGLIGVIPYGALFVAMQINGWHSDRNKERRLHSAVPMFLGAAGLVGLLFHPDSITLTVGLFSLVSVGACYLPTFWAIPTEILSKSAAAGAVGLINTVGSAAGFAGPFLFGYLQTRTASSSAGLVAMLVCVTAGGMITLLLPGTRRGTLSGEPASQDPR